MRIYKEEIFGPVIVLIPFSSEDEAIQISNDTFYGLTNYIQTKDKEKAKRIEYEKRQALAKYIQSVSADNNSEHVESTGQQQSDKVSSNA